ncbi:MAG: tetratricopeptide repeat protein [Vampirovibrionales bacterium]|nr:tetratricopeptide repeat protein [Vampirovibrionales bacterium]
MPRPLVLAFALFCFILGTQVTFASVYNPFGWGKSASEKPDNSSARQSPENPPSPKALTGLSSSKSDTQPVAEPDSKPQPKEKKEDLMTNASQAKELYNKGVDAFQLAQFQGSRGNQAGQLNLYKSAEKLFKKALTLDSTLIEAKTNLGYLWLAQERPKKAIVFFQQALATHPNHVSALNGLANAYVLQKQFAQAEATFQQLVKLSPGQADYWFNLGSVLQKDGKPEDARVAYQQALKLEPTHQRTLFNLATLCHNQGQLNDAKRYYEQAKQAGIETPVGLEALRRLRILDKSESDAQPVDAG